LICLIPDVRVTIIVTIILHISLLVGMVADWFRERIKISAAIDKPWQWSFVSGVMSFPKGHQYRTWLLNEHPKNEWTFGETMSKLQTNNVRYMLTLYMSKSANKNVHVVRLLQ